MDPQPTPSQDPSPNEAGPSDERKRPTTAKRRAGKPRSGDVSAESRIGLPEPEYLNLGDASEDIITDTSEVPAPDVVQSIPEGTTSQPSEKVYIQEVAGFRKAQRKQYETSLMERQKQAAAESAASNGEYVHTTAEAIQTGITSQTVFRTVAVTLQGLLAGFTIAHCLMVVFDTAPYFSNSHFISHYARLALAAHCLYYVVLVICTLAALDRYDIGQSFIRVIYRAVTFQSGGLAVIFYLAATIVNQVSIFVEERMTLYFHNATDSSPDRQQPILSEQPWMESDMQVWRGCLIAKAVLVTLAWIFLAIRPGTDLLVKHLRQADTEFEKEFQEQRPESADKATVSDVVPAIIK